MYRCREDRSVTGVGTRRIIEDSKRSRVVVTERGVKSIAKSRLRRVRNGRLFRSNPTALTLDACKIAHTHLLRNDVRRLFRGECSPEHLGFD